ncbi:MAG: hypothetical protein J1F66_03905 [Clostridiales bacterium]|nr:hypothetical protein [Clostridiales bacterium]
MTFDVNVGQYLSQVFAENRAAHAYIVVGEKQYLGELLTECAIVAMCDSHTFDGCDTCKKVVDRAHQDVMRLPIDTQKNRLSVADISYLVEESNKRPVDDSARARVFLIDASNSVSYIGSELWQNKLLKTLEEPTDGVYIFLGVTDVEGLLPTVRSRCQVLKQTVLTVSEVKDALVAKGFETGACEMAAAMSGGSVQTGERLLNNQAVFAAYQTAISIAEQMTSTKNALRFASAILSNRDTVNDCLGFLTVLLRESIVCRLASQLLLLPKMKNTTKAICANYTLDAAEGCIELINDAKRKLDAGGNVTVVVDALLADILEMRYQCRR